MKYRRLTQEELREVEQEFIQYLAGEGIPSEEWAQMLVLQEGIDDHLDAFSELFFDRATGAIEFLERENEGETWLFRFGETNADLIRLMPNDSGQFRISGTGQQSYEPEARGREIFLLLEQGACPCDGERFLKAQSANPC